MRYSNIFYLPILTIFLFLSPSCEVSEEQKAAEIHDQVLTVDTHCDTPLLALRGEFEEMIEFYRASGESQ